MKESIESNVGNIAPVADRAPAAPATTATTAVAVGTGGGALYDFDGEVDKSDIKIPRLNLVQSVGPLCDDFPRGSWVVNRSVVIASLGDPFTFIPLRARKMFVEAVEYGGEKLPRRFNTREDVLTAGLRLDFDPVTGDKPEVNPSLDVTLLVRADEKTEAPEFSLEFDGSKYALVLWSMNSWSSYQNAATVLLTARTMYLKSFHAREWNAHSEKNKLKNGNTTFIPKLSAGVTTTEAFRKWADELLGA